MKVSHYTISIVFSVVTLASSLKIAGTIGFYAVFKANFIERFCENIDRPELNCDGKCELSKMLLQEADKNEAPINIDFLRSETVLFIDSIYSVEFALPISKSLIDVEYINNYHFGLIDRVTRPPQV